MEYLGGKNELEDENLLLFFAFQRGQKATEAAREIRDVYGEGVIDESTARQWVAKFKNSDFDVEGRSCSGRPSVEVRLKSLLKENGRQTSRELAEKINCDHKTISNHLNSMGFTKKLGVWVLYELNEKKEVAFKATRGHKQRQHKYEAKKRVGGFRRYVKAERLFD